MAVPVPNVGFLAILQEPNGTLGGYLATNAWGRPLEFRLTSAVQPTRVQTILYGASLPGFLCGELIAKTLIEKSTASVQWLVTDSPHVVELRPHVAFPIAYLSTAAPGSFLSAGRNLYTHLQFPADVVKIQEFLAQSPSLDLSDPFIRIREAVVEARKMGLAQRAAA